MVTLKTSEVSDFEKHQISSTGNGILDLIIPKCFEIDSYSFYLDE